MRSVLISTNFNSKSNSGFESVTFAILSKVTWKINWLFHQPDNTLRCNVRLRIVCILSSGFKSPEKIFLVCKTCWSNDGCRHNSNNIGELGKYVRHFLKLLLLSLYFYRLKRPNSSNFYHPTFFGISRNANETFWKARSINIMKQYKEFLFFVTLQESFRSFVFWFFGSLKYLQTSA